MTVLKEWKVAVVPTESEPDEHEIVVERTEDEIVIHWVCGATRTFEPATLKRALEHFDLVMANDGAGDLWFNDRDSANAGYIARLDDGNFMAHDSMMPTDEAHRVPWDEFNAALKAAIPKPRIRKAKKS